MADLLGTKFEDDVVTTPMYWKTFDGKIDSHSESEYWVTFEKKIKKICEIDHQHLSNIIYFMKFVNPSYYSDRIKKRFEIEIKNRFAGIIMPWRPLRRFEGEINFLKCKGWLRQEGDKTLIVIDDKLIGIVAEE